MAGPALIFCSGVGVSLIGALVSNILTTRRERRRLVNERRFEIFMKLLDLYGSYFWFTAAELHKETVPREIRKRCHDLAWQIADMLRSADELESIEEILDVLLGSSFDTAAKRYEEMGRILDQLGRRVNPRYSSKIRKISEQNIHIMTSGRPSNAPGTTSELWK
jgi:hypothetical protein